MTKPDTSISQEVCESMQIPHDPSQHGRLRELIMGFRNTQLVAVAAKLNLAEYVKNGPKTSMQLSATTGIGAGSLYRLLRALTSIGIFDEIDKNTFAITPLGSLLCDQTPHSLRSVAILYGEEWLWKAYSQLSYSIEKGQPAFDYVHGQSLYDYLKHDHVAAEKFNNAMSAFSQNEAEAISGAYSFSSAQRIVDIGGGQGAFVSALLKVNPHLSGIVFDRPDVIDTIQTGVTTSEKNLKISYAPGDFFSEVPDGGDTYILKSVLHNWDDNSCITILRNCRKAMKDDGRLLIIERIVPSGNEKSEAKLFDVNMLVMTGGQERTGEEYGKLLTAAGYTLSRVISTLSPVGIIEAIPKG